MLQDMSFRLNSLVWKKVLISVCLWILGCWPLRRPSAFCQDTDTDKRRLRAQEVQMSMEIQQKPSVHVSPLAECNSQIKCFCWYLQWMEGTLIQSMSWWTDSDKKKGGGGFTHYICKFPHCSTDTWINTWINVYSSIMITHEGANVRHIYGAETSLVSSNKTSIRRMYFNTFFYVETRPVFYWSVGNPCVTVHDWMCAEPFNYYILQQVILSRRNTVRAEGLMFCQFVIGGQRVWVLVCFLDSGINAPHSLKVLSSITRSCTYLRTPPLAACELQIQT